MQKRALPIDTLAEVARLMWDNDCGILPVVEDGRKVVGLITDYTPTTAKRPKQAQRNAKANYISMAC
jgi:CBS domain-containing protein